MCVGGEGGDECASVCICIYVWHLRVCVCERVCVCVSSAKNLVLNNYIFSSTAGTLEPDAIMRERYYNVGQLGKKRW